MLPLQISVGTDEASTLTSSDESCGRNGQQELVVTKWGLVAGLKVGRVATESQAYAAALAKI